MSNWICRDCDEVFDEPSTETWSDSGDYPSGAGGFALPDREIDVCPNCQSGEFVRFDEETESESMIEKICETLGEFDCDRLKKIHTQFEAELKKQKKESEPQ